MPNVLPDQSVLIERLSSVDIAPHPHRAFHAMLLDRAGAIMTDSDVALWFCSASRKYIGGVTPNLFLFMSRSDLYLEALVPGPSLVTIQVLTGMVKRQYWLNMQKGRPQPAFYINTQCNRTTNLIENLIGDLDSQIEALLQTLDED